MKNTQLYTQPIYNGSKIYIGSISAPFVKRKILISTPNDQRIVRAKDPKDRRKNMTARKSRNVSLVSFSLSVLWVEVDPQESE